MSAKKPTTVSLFCGGGGESIGKHLAFKELGIPVEKMSSHAVNHWDLAVAAHARNLPWVEVRQEDITQVTARDFGLEEIDLLWASPSCVHHSRARGGKPREEQQRSHAWEVLERWIEVARVKVFLVENVPEFLDWGPLDERSQPIKARAGEYFQAFAAKLRALGYAVEWRILCAADYGDPTVRRRLFLQAVRDGIPISWPEPTHRDPRRPVELFDRPLPPWRSAAECIDWTLPVPSIFDRKKPLAEATLRRVAAGVVRYVLNGRPFIAPVPGGSTDLAAHTLVQTGFGERDGQAPRCLDIKRPLGTVVAGGSKHALVSAFIARHYKGMVGSPMTSPLPTVTAIDHHSVVAAELRRSELASPELTNRVAAFLIAYYSHGGQLGRPDEPLRAVTTMARHGLVTVEIEGETYAIVDVGLRMMSAAELGRAMSFPDWYRWETRDGGRMTQKDAIKMIGNAVPINTAKELIKAVVGPRRADYLAPRSCPDLRPAA